MSKSQNKSGIIKKVEDEALIDFFYLKYELEELIDKLHSLEFSFTSDKSKIPFNAQLREYLGTVDNDDHFWIVKKVDDSKLLNNRLYELAYYLDFELQTLSAPTLVIKIDGDFYRATKVIIDATQISGYDYTIEPLRKVFANDLINRWLMFDEDRNPNNYMIIRNSKEIPLVVAIDYNNTDLRSEQMKITGREDQFGWIRTEKTRFLTLLKPSNFESYCIEDFQKRLDLMMKFSERRLKKICERLFMNIVDNPKEEAKLITSNIIRRRQYIYDYFVRWFKKKGELKRDEDYCEYSGLGKNFVDIYKRKV